MGCVRDGVSLGAEEVESRFPRVSQKKNPFCVPPPPFNEPIFLLLYATHLSFWLGEQISRTLSFYYSSCIKWEMAFVQVGVRCGVARGWW